METTTKNIQFEQVRVCPWCHALARMHRWLEVMYCTEGCGCIESEKNEYKFECQRCYELRDEEVCDCHPDTNNMCPECTGSGIIDLRTPCKLCNMTGVYKPPVYKFRYRFKTNFAKGETLPTMDGWMDITENSIAEAEGRVHNIKLQLFSITRI